MSPHPLNEKKPTQGASLEWAKGGTAKTQSCTTNENRNNMPPAQRSYGGDLGSFKRLALQWFKHV